MKKFYPIMMLFLLSIASLTQAQDMIVGGNMEDAAA